MGGRESNRETSGVGPLVCRAETLRVALRDRGSKGGEHLGDHGPTAYLDALRRSRSPTPPARPEARLPRWTTRSAI